MVEMKRSKLQLMGLIGATLLVAACGGNGHKKIFGMSRHSPDEFAVIERAPLQMPDSYELAAPTPGVLRPQERKVRDQARQELFAATNEIEASEVATTAEQEFLKAANATDTDPNIRYEIDRETKRLVAEDDSLLDEWLYWGDVKPGAIVDAPAEAERLAKNKAEGKPLNEGETAPILPEKDAPLEGFFK